MYHNHIKDPIGISCQITNFVWLQTKGRNMRKLLICNIALSIAILTWADQPSLEGRINESLVRMNIADGQRLLDLFPELKTKSTNVTDNCYDSTVDQRSKKVIDIFKADVPTIVREYFVSI